MPPDNPGGWVLDGFADHLEGWAQTEAPSEEVYQTVMRWILTRASDPYQGVRRVSDFPNFWFAAIPGTVNHADQVVCCTYAIVEADHMVRCMTLATLSLPVEM